MPRAFAYFTQTGLTEGFVADLSKSQLAYEKTTYGLAGTFVESPLCWAIVTGARRKGIDSVADLQGKRVGVSRIGSGSYVMSYVLADQHGWLSPGKDPFDAVVAGDFAALRQSVQDTGPNPSDFFMWEHFTTRKYWENGELKRIGEIYTPWASWMIAARHTAKEDLDEFLGKINKGVEMFQREPNRAVEHITSTMHYSEADAREWMKGVRFAQDVRGVDSEMAEKTVGILRKAGVLEGDLDDVGSLVSLKR
jgi:hypothetical protein